MLTIAAGASTASFHYTTPPRAPHRRLPRPPLLLPGTQQETVVAAAPSQLAFVTAAQTLTAGTASQTITVDLEDAFGNPNAPAAPERQPDSTSAQGTFQPQSPLTIAAGDDSASFQYTDTLAGTPTLTGHLAGLVSGSQEETVTSAAASQLAFTTSPQSLQADGVGNDHRHVGGRRRQRDRCKQPCCGEPERHLAAGHVRAVVAAHRFPPAAGIVEFRYTDTSAGAPTITATASGLPAAAQHETVNPAAAGRLTFTAATNASPLASPPVRSPSRWKIPPRQSGSMATAR